jgi:hypothetical protein
MNKIKVLELFAGTKSIGKAAKELGYDVFSSDIDPMFETDYTIDLLDFNTNQIPWKPDIIWASVPCTSFSIASSSYHWTKDRQPKTETAVIGYKLVEKTLELINYYKPTYWYIENPRGLLRKFPIMEALPIRHTVTYCQYGDYRMKPTDIWTNNSFWIPKPICYNEDECYIPSNDTKMKIIGLNSAQIRSIIPHELCLEVMSQVKF